MPTDRRSSRRALFLTAVAVLLMIGASRPGAPLLLYNRTASLPIGFYLYTGRSSIRRGDIVALVLPPAARPYAQLRGDSTDLLLIKHVLAVRGDFVCTLHGELRINGIRVGPIASVDSTGRPLPRWSAARLLRDEELLVGSSQPRSFDGRYFGPIHANQVLGVYQKLRFPFNTPTVTGSLCDPLSFEHPPPIARCASGGPSEEEHLKAKGREHESRRAR